MTRKAATIYFLISVCSLILPTSDFVFFQYWASNPSSKNDSDFLSLATSRLNFSKASIFLFIIF